MASNVNVKLGVSGVSQFKQGMSQAKSSVKTLDAELALNEKQFKATGDSQEYMQKKADLLKQKLEEQKKIVENAEKALKQMQENGVDKASAAYQNMQQSLLRAKGDLIDTENAMNGVTEAGDGASDSVSEMNSQLSKIGKGISYQNVTDGLNTISDGMKKVVTKAWQMGEAIVKATLGAGSWADELKTTAAQYEITPEELQRMRKTANIIDTDVDTIITAQDKLKKNREGQDKEFMGALAYLGIDPSGKNDLDLFWEAGEAIAKLGKNEDKVSYAQKIFGKSWRDLLPLFQAGRKEYEKTNAAWSVVEEDQLDNLGKMDDAYQKMSSEWETFKMEMLSAFSGPLTEGMDTITGLFQELNKYLDSPEGQAMLQQLGDTISGLLSDLTSVSPEDAINGLKGVVDGVVDGLKWISDNKDKIVAGVEAFIGAWAGLEVAKGVTTLLKLVNAIRGITAGEAAAAGTTAGSSWASAFATAAMKAAPFLAFLYTLLNPSDTHDEIGNGDLLDENGKLTKEAEEYGYSLDENGELVQGEVPEKFSKQANPVTVDLDKPHKLLVASAPYVLGDDATIEDAFAAVRESAEDMSEAAAKLATKYTGNTEDAKARNAARLSGAHALENRMNPSGETAAAETAQALLKANNLGTLVQDVINNLKVADAAIEEEIADHSVPKSVPTENWEYGDDWTIDEIMADLAKKEEKMEAAAEDLTTGADAQTRSSNELSQTAVVLKGMPQLVANAVEAALAGVKIYIDGQSAGSILTPYVNTDLGPVVDSLIK